MIFPNERNEEGEFVRQEDQFRGRVTRDGSSGYPADGVYRAGFATTQSAYEQAVRALFNALDQIEGRLKSKRYLVGNQMTEADWRLFTTLIRFDAVYYVHFKCNIRRIVDYPNLYGYLRDLYQHEGIAETVNFNHIKRHYYTTHTDINPTRIVPIGPELDLNLPHSRNTLSEQARR